MMGGRKLEAPIFRHNKTGKHIIVLGEASQYDPEKDDILAALSNVVQNTEIEQINNLYVTNRGLRLDPVVGDKYMPGSWVVYLELKTGEFWARPKLNFYERVDGDTPRFSLVKFVV